MANVGNVPHPYPDQQKGPEKTPGLPERGQEPSPVPPIIGNDDTKNPNDPLIKPALMPGGDPSGMA